MAMFDEEELLFLETVGRQVCLAVERARHLHAERLHNQEARALASLNKRIGEMLDTLLALSTRKDIRIEVDPERLRPIDADLQVPNTAKFTAHTGWQPKIPFQQTMEDLLGYWRERVASTNNYLTR